MRTPTNRLLAASVASLVLLGGISVGAAAKHPVRSHRAAASRPQTSHAKSARSSHAKHKKGHKAARKHKKAQH